MKTPSTHPKSVKVPWNFEGTRFDTVAYILSDDWFTPPLSRTRIREDIEGGLILVNDTPQNIRLRVSKGDTLVFTKRFFEKYTHQEKAYPEGEEPYIIEENESFLGVYKPASWLTHTVALYQSEGTLEDWLLQKGIISSKTTNNGRVHRLDRNTSGIILYAKTDAAKQSLKKLFQKRDLQKVYIALTEGHLSSLEGVVSEPIIRKKGSFKRLIAKSNTEAGAKTAETKYRVISRLQKHDLLWISPLSGRTHQIRVHMKFLEHPVAGDTLYGGKKDLIKRQFLHAWSITFTLNKKNYVLTCPLPEDLKNAYFSLDGAQEFRYDNEALQTLELKQV